MRPYRRMMRSELRDLLEESGADGRYARCIDDLRIDATFRSIDDATAFMKYVALLNKWTRYNAVKAKLLSLTLHTPQEGRWVHLTLKFDPDYLKSLHPAGADA